MGALLSALIAFAPVNATNYVKDKDLTAETTVAAADTIMFYDTSAGNTLKATIANIFAGAGNIGAGTIVTVGALDSGSITSGFGNIDNGTSNITSGGIWSVDVDGTGLGAAGAITFGASGDSGEYFDGTDHVITSSVDIVYGAAGDDHIFKSSGDTIVATIDDTGIDIVTNDYTTGGQYVIDVDGSAVAAAGSITFGAGSDSGEYWDGTAHIISSSADITYQADGDDHLFQSSFVTQATIDDTGIDIITGNAYSINATSVLNATTLGSGVVTSSLTTVGALASGTIATGFGVIDNGTSNITSGGIWRVDVDGTGLGAAGALGFGAGTDDSGEYWDGSDHIITSTGGTVFGVVEASDYNFFEVSTETARIDFSDSTSATALMLWNRADNSLQRVTVGANDTGGTGFRALHIPNL
jgi:hypothetical protein